MGGISALRSMRDQRSLLIMETMGGITRSVRANTCRRLNHSKKKPVHPLHVSAFVGNFVLFKHVLARTGDIYARNSNGWQASHFAVLRHILKNNRGSHSFLGMEKEMPIISLMDKIGYRKVLPDVEISCVENI